jgi:hypothetical protein
MTDETLEGEVMTRSPMDRVSTPSLDNSDGQPRSLSVIRRLYEMNYNPADTLIHIAMGNSEALGTDEEIRVFERRAAATELLSYATPKVKAKEHIDTEEVIKPVLQFAPRRGADNTILIEKNGDDS